ncbi:hypothetical protein [Bradyrhizobium sp. Ce-3]|uniref:hypothetical protein n=1 Tax=Bradyrhizobium sp. Ce-3 TaxID=2913970 RepID=UPI001FC82259|nr:hypothetical protein [Bradyrhizobium sp. Ce-3]
MSTFNVRAGTKVPRIGNAPTHFIARPLTLHQPETRRCNRKHNHAAIHRQFTVCGDVVSRDSMEHRATRICIIDRTPHSLRRHHFSESANMIVLPS